MIPTDDDALNPDRTVDIPPPQGEARGEARPAAEEEAFLRIEPDSAEAAGLRESLQGLRDGPPEQKGLFYLRRGHRSGDMKMIMVGSLGRIRLHISAQNILKTRTDAVFMPQFPDQLNDSGIAGQAVGKWGTDEPIAAYETFRRASSPALGDALLTPYAARRRETTAAEPDFALPTATDERPGAEGTPQAVDLQTLGTAVPHLAHSIVHTVTARRMGQMTPHQRILYRREQFSDVERAVVKGIEAIARHNAELPPPSPLRIRHIALPLIGSGGDGALTTNQSANALLKTLDAHQTALQAAGVEKIEICAFSPPRAGDKDRREHLRRGNRLVSQVAHIYEYALYRQTGNIAGDKRYDPLEAARLREATRRSPSRLPAPGADRSDGASPHDISLGGGADSPLLAPKATSRVRPRKTRASDPSRFGHARDGHAPNAHAPEDQAQGDQAQGGRDEERTR